MEAHILIPARYAASRFPGKLLADLAGQPVLYHTWSRAQQVGVESVTIVTDDERIQKQAQCWGAQVLLSRSDHATGTSRIAEIIQQETERFSKNAVILNMQGDEPLLPLSHLQQLLEMMQQHEDPDTLATLCELETAPAHLASPHTVKVVRNYANEAVYFSRAWIPYQAPVGERHIGVYAYRAAFLRYRYPSLPASSWAQQEQLEQLQWLQAGCKIYCLRAQTQTPKGIDTLADLEAARLWWAEQDHPA